MNLRLSDAEEAKGEANAADYLAYQQQQATLRLANQRYVARKLAQVQVQGAKAVYQSQVEAGD